METPRVATYTHPVTQDVRSKATSEDPWHSRRMFDSERDTTCVSGLSPQGY